VIAAPGGPAALAPTPDGTLRGRAAVPVAFSAPRLHGQIGPGFRIDGISVWGAGTVGSLRLGAQPPVDSLVTWPNGCEQSSGQRRLRVEALQDLPALSLEVEWDAPVRLHLEPAAEPGPPHPDSLPHPAGAMTWRAGECELSAVLPWGALALWAKGARVEGDALLVPARCRAFAAAGADLDEALGALQRLRSSGAPLAATRRYRDWLTSRLQTQDPLLGSLMVQALHAACASRKRGKAGRFAGLSAGVGYSWPARTYYRDAYWTAQPLLAFQPALVRDELRLFAAGIHDDGEAPSAVVLDTGGEAAGEAWRDHFDSPLFLPILADQYVSLTGDRGLLDERAGARTVRRSLRLVADRYLGFAKAGSGLPLKPRHERDWADNVYREGAVAYDVMLYLGALRALARIEGADAGGSGRAASDQRQPRLAAAFADGQRALDAALWLSDRGHYADYRTPDGFLEDHLAIDSICGVWLSVLPEARAQTLLGSVSRLLVTRDDQSQPFGDWGLRCCRPEYRRAADTRDKSAFPLRYHNGADWPYWDAAFAACLLRAGRPAGEWRYPLLRSWEHGLSQGWSSPVEYASPPFPRGALLQAWSGLAAAAVAIGFGWSPFGGGRVSRSPFGEATLDLGSPPA
jgi:hypothetical protein